MEGMQDMLFWSCFHLEPTLSVECLVYIRPIYRPPCLHIAQLWDWVIFDQIHECRATWCIIAQASMMLPVGTETYFPDCHKECSRLTSRNKSCSGVTAWAVCTVDSRMAALRPTEPTAIPTCTAQAGHVLLLCMPGICVRLCLQGICFNLQRRAP